MSVGVKVYSSAPAPDITTVSFNHLYVVAVSPSGTVTQVNVVSTPFFASAGPVIPVILAAEMLYMLSLYCKTLKKVPCQT